MVMWLWKLNNSKKSEYENSILDSFDDIKLKLKNKLLYIQINYSKVASEKTGKI